MGLGANFKKYVARTFPGAHGREDAPTAVVVDGMVVLHTFAPRPDEATPAQRLAGSLWHHMSDAPHAALCFDVSETTPSAKAIEWANRPAPAVAVLSSDVEAGLLFDQLPNYASLISSRRARATLCRWLAQECVARMRASSVVRTLLVLHDCDPVLYQKLEDGSLVRTQRQDLARSLHGEADVSGIFAARFLWRECCGCSGVVECRTSDTDWVLIGVLNCFPGLRVRMHHFDRASRLPVFQTVRCDALARDAARLYGITVHEFAALVASRGTDFVTPLLSGGGEWEEYMDACAGALKKVKSRTCCSPVTEGEISVSALHAVFVEASERRQRARLRYAREDGELSRLAWHLFYMMHCPERGGEGLDCTRFGWTETDAGAVQKRRVVGAPSYTYSLSA